MGSLPVESKYLQYPSARRDESVVDNYHGVVLSDPYRWMENPEAEEVKDFVQKQQDITESVLKSCWMRGKLVEKITKLIDHHRYSVPFRHADKYFYFHNTGLQAQDAIYIKHGLEGKVEVLLDPNGLSEDGTVSLKSLAVSPDANYLAYGESSSGSDWQTIKVMEIESRRIGTDSLSRVSLCVYIN